MIPLTDHSTTLNPVAFPPAHTWPQLRLQVYPSLPTQPPVLSQNRQTPPNLSFSVPLKARAYPQPLCSSRPTPLVVREEQTRISHNPHSACRYPRLRPTAKESQAAWARLLAKIYEVDPLRCRKCGSEMRVLAVITDPDEVRKILKHLIKIGRPPPGLAPLALN